MTEAKGIFYLKQANSIKNSFQKTFNPGSAAHGLFLLFLPQRNVYSRLKIYKAKIKLQKHLEREYRRLAL